MPQWIQAGLWGLLAGSALLIGAAIGWFVKVSQSVVAIVMSFGSGVLISALSFELMDEAVKRGGFNATAIGFICGAAVYTAANLALARFGARRRKTAGSGQPSEEQQPGSGMAIALGSLMDGVPESIVIGLTLLKGGAVGWVAVVAIFLSNIPESLSGASGMKRAGRGAAYIFGLWGGIVVISAIAATVGYVVFQHFSPQVVAATTAVAAGAILAMLADTMIPEAFKAEHNYAGFVTVAGFLAAFWLSKLAK